MDSNGSNVNQDTEQLSAHNTNGESDSCNTLRDADTDTVLDIFFNVLEFIASIFLQH